jgi:hypothetical protein
LRASFYGDSIGVALKFKERGLERVSFFELESNSYGHHTIIGFLGSKDIENI